MEVVERRPSLSHPSFRADIPTDAINSLEIFFWPVVEVEAVSEVVLGALPRRRVVVCSREPSCSPKAIQTGYGLKCSENNEGAQALIKQKNYGSEYWRVKMKTRGSAGGLLACT